MAEYEMRFQALDEPERDRSSSGRRRRLLTLAIAGGVTLAGLVTALVLGTFGYDIRRANMHGARLKGILVQEPTEYQVTEGLKEKAPLVMIVDSPASLDKAIDAWGGDKAEEIREKAAKWPLLRVYDAGDTMYFIFFDATKVMRDYVYVTHRNRKGGSSE